MSEKHEPFNRLREAIDRHHETHGTDDDLVAIRSEVVKQTDEGESPDEGLVDRFSHAAKKFETDHFELTQSLNEVAYFLSGEGL
jgi:hypothetical protein